MADSSLIIPSKYLLDKSINPTQKLILSFISKNQNSYLLNISKGIGIRSATIKDEIKGLVDSNRLFSTNGKGRAKYSTVKGFNFASNPITIPDTGLSSKHTCILRSNILNNFKDSYYQSKDKLISAFGIGESAVKAIDYWSDNGGMKHRVGSANYEESVDLLMKLFNGKAFRYVDDDKIPEPKINRRRKFNLLDWMTAIDNLNISLTDPRYKPYNKDKAKAWRKKLTLPKFIYNPFAKDGQSKSRFLICLKGPQLLEQEKDLNPELTRALTNLFKKSNLKLKPNIAQIVSIANKLPLLAKKHNWRWVSKGDAAHVFIDFIDHQFGTIRFRPYYMSAPWFITEFENYLDQQGLITLYE